VEGAIDVKTPINWRPINRRTVREQKAASGCRSSSSRAPQRDGLELEPSDERKLLRAMINQVPDYLFMKDVDCRFVMVNDAVARIHNFSRPEDMIGKTDLDFHAPELAAVFLVEREVIRTGMPMIDMEEEVIDETGRPRKRLSIAVRHSRRSRQNPNRAVLAHGFSCR
jgi:PAS domain S-box-containing protein